MRSSWNLRILTVLAMIILPALAARAAQTYDAIYVFGDSYCDVGNIYIATKHAEPLSPPYYQGRFSNGPIWVDHLAGTFKLPMVPELAGGTDYAFGGALLLEDEVTPEGTIPSVFSQVDLYLAKHGGKADPNALYVLEGGGNDILDFPPGSSASVGTDLGFDIGAALASIESELRSAGAKHFLIPSLFDVGLLPAGRANAVFDEAATVAANQELAQLLAIEVAQGGVNIYSPDTYALGNAIATDPSHFGFTDVINPCLNTTTGKVCADPANTLFWDDEHPTTFGHAFLTVASEALVHP
jgi:phospholipase/lecithinase/hemolysin